MHSKIFKVFRRNAGVQQVYEVQHAPHVWQINMLQVAWFIYLVELSTTSVPAEREDHRKVPKQMYI